MRYKATITEIGPMVQDFIGENMIIIFDNNAPDALRDMAVLHSIEEWERDITIGDELVVCEKRYKVTAIGNEANETLKTMGHCTLMFNGADTAQLPGHIELSGDGLPDLSVGMSIEIIYS
ncbi:PTS glucitol/sorbitol transporter subunit IIA [Eubacterium aggregans]|uniref:PTS glucitol/sorbitol transporter subunit IIA n=1 Tax=Eubacterium aggregans TaxID=81409 RepID=UPI003F3A80B4